MRADAILINIARGPIVDTDALVSELRNNRIRGAALDVTDPEPLPEDHPLWGLGNVTITRTTPATPLTTTSASPTSSRRTSVGSTTATTLENRVL